MTLDRCHAPLMVGFVLAFVTHAVLADERPQPRNPLPEADGYRGLWYANQPSQDEYKFKYSGGMATYPQQHIPIAYYAAEAKKTFFVYGGTRTDRDRVVAHDFILRPRYGHGAAAAHPARQADRRRSRQPDADARRRRLPVGLFQFARRGRPSFIHRSLKPYSIDAFQHRHASFWKAWQPTISPIRSPGIFRIPAFASCKRATPAASGSFSGNSAVTAARGKRRNRCANRDGTLSD